MKGIEYYLAQNYRTSVYRDEDGDYVVEVDDLPGCVSHGSTPDEAFQNLEEAKRAWMESRAALGLEIPEPRQLGDYSGRVLLRMPKWLHRRMALQSRVEGVSLNQHLVTLLADASASQDVGPSQALQAPIVVYEAGWTLPRSSQYVIASNPTNYVVQREAFSHRLRAGMLTGLAQGEARVVSVHVGKSELQEEATKEGISPFPSA